MDRLVGVSFAIPVSRDGTKVNFTMIYGRGWYNHRKGFQRVELDIAAKKKAIAQPFPLSPSPLQAHPTGVNKRQCAHHQRYHDGLVCHGVTAPLAALGHLYRCNAHGNCRICSTHCVNTSWSHQLKLVDLFTNNMLILPSILPVPDSPRTIPSNNYIDGSKPDGQSVTRATVSLDLMLEEFALLDAHVAVVKSSFTTMCSQPGTLPRSSTSLTLLPLAQRTVSSRFCPNTRWN
ncbi:hypothetical protein H257_10651 [Aphanomyces astaci]|uniref:Uncharacterized protein n=1 Tax=Aphanomyces astaci TaxID=112090 RepID=W4G717_APHAT|nr:hypothetical protein H257_10651 [Aphanomyces astaci]ETV75051.1 hypothetical protein H257_10651 [Aphanomyces astaci]|eukprot:XP_009835555.1 hypothetical protein H257_10651 [Aphanomyces astaci]